jgi:alpha-beta hydrolase superfamily lysophospholipase
MTDMKPPSFSFVTTEFQGATLHGVRSDGGRGDRLLIHAHGTWGNFYANPFVGPIAGVSASLGIDFLSLNFPGHDETAVNERFDDFAPALEAWLDAIGSNYESLILQGHSLGALKILAYLQNHDSVRTRRISGAILLSPFDIVAFYSHGNLDALAGVRRRIEQLAGAEGGAALVPNDVFDMWQVSCQSFLELSSDGGPADLFPTRRASLLGTAITNVTVPVLSLFGGNDFASYPTAGAARDMVQSLGRTSLTAKLFDGAPHNFAGKTDQLAASIQPWLRNVK